MGATRLRYTMLGFIIGVLIVWMKELPISSGVRFAAPFYGAGIGLLIDNMILRIRQRRQKDE
ncbi:hypothetical protein G3578_19855 [Brevibacillus sp. SYP-B805]|uniref:hypothetical protein n=1 Tax=Brevibacillus sp. SYP-B805 TaxID=1578199 RepID=UPI0013EC0AD5|nr:hypothetical protein [Brevibacillus sp. SYP-B805]NGQ97397.1 hypothetical protein [Brevibacillus sp. SYP-B805]